MVFAQASEESDILRWNPIFSDSLDLGGEGNNKVRANDTKGRGQKMPGKPKKMDQAAESGGGSDSPSEHASPESDMDKGLEPNLQAHIGRHVREAFDEVAREPIPDHLLQLLKELERGGGK